MHDVTPRRRNSLPRATWGLVKAFVAGTLLSLRFVVRAGLLLAAIVAAIVFVGNAVTSKSRTESYRAGDPAEPICGTRDRGWTVLADVGNDEGGAVRRDGAWAERFACAVQTHALPATADQPELRYHLAFLEFDEQGTPYALHGNGKMAGTGTQLDALVRHLKGRPSNYVIAFVHGWRHDASLGDGNVSDLRIYASQVAGILAERCALENRWCGTEVTAVYVSWPGARVDEARLRSALGPVGEVLGTIATIPTLFDRKPVSEAVAPAVYSALAEVAQTLNDKKPAADPQRLIAFGHSLGGNLLISALKDPLIKSVVRHAPGASMRPPIGDLVVLINPASEASNWTAIQRAVWSRIAFTPSEGSQDELEAGHIFFPPEQKPILISVTAARFWPPGGVREADCHYLMNPGELKINKNKVQMLKDLRDSNKDTSKTLFAAGVDYDWATFDLFPTFRGDLRPISGSLKRWAARQAGWPSPDDACAETPATEATTIGQVVGGVVWKVADWLGYFPLMNTDVEYTRTIGHLDPPRPAVGSVANTRLPRRMLGTTHELLGTSKNGSELPAGYGDARAKPTSCPPSTGWLWKARHAETVRPFGVYWDSTDMRASDDPPDLSRHASPALRFVHGFGAAGMAPITRANDPFWNMRAFDDALARHDGYLLPSFICAMNQLVLDEVTASTDGSQEPTISQP